MIDRPQALGLLPACAERVVARLERDGRRLAAEDGVEAARARPDGAAAHLHHGQSLGIEVNEGVEEVEEHGGVARAHSGFRVP